MAYMVEGSGLAQTTRIAGPGAVAGLPTDQFVRIVSGPTTYTLPTQAQGLVPGSSITIFARCQDMQTVSVVPGAGDDIYNGTNFPIAQLGAVVTFYAYDKGGGGTSWVPVVRGTQGLIQSPTQPTFAGPGTYPAGSASAPGGVRSVREIQIITDNPLTGGTLTLTATLGQGGTTAVSPGQAIGSSSVVGLWFPGQRNTTPSLSGFGNLITFSLVAGGIFTGPTTAYCSVEFW